MRAASPADTFIELWRFAGQQSPAERTFAESLVSIDSEALRQVLLLDDGAEAQRQLEALWATFDGVSKLGFALRAMALIDEVVYPIHPRSVLVPGQRVPRPNWVNELRDQYFLYGVLAATQEHRLVFRGPLVRNARTHLVCSADSLEDRFAALTTVEATCVQAQRRLPVKHVVVPANALAGVTATKAPGSETVAVVPIAESECDLTHAIVERGEARFVDFFPSLSCDPVEAMQSAITAAADADIVVGSELLVGESHLASLREKLGVQPCAARLIVCGSGPTAEADENGMAWNESCVLNSYGSVLWKQRKVWPASIDRVRCAEFGVEPPATYYENNAAGDEVVIADVEGLGRCLILICQDLQSSPAATELVRAYQTDWVFSPSLDKGAGEGRWAHRRAFELSALAATRYVVVSSTALAARAGWTNVPCAVVVGPQLGSEADLERAVAFVTAGSERGARFGVITWRSGDARWVQTVVATAVQRVMH
jgi:hypothetical protein